MTEPDASPIVREAAMQEICLQAEFDGDGRVLSLEEAPYLARGAADFS